MNKYTVSVRNNQAFSKTYSKSLQDILDMLFEWADRSTSKINILNYIIRNINQYGSESHPSQETIGKNAGVGRWWVNKVTNELVALGLITKTRVIVDGKETACEYALTPILQDSKIRWALKDILPALKWTHIPKVIKTVTQAMFSRDHTPYIKIYFKKNFKILYNSTKSIFRDQKVKISKDRENLPYKKPQPTPSQQQKPIFKVPSLERPVEDVEETRRKVQEAMKQNPRNSFLNILFKGIL